MLKVKKEIIYNKRYNIISVQKYMKTKKGDYTSSTSIYWGRYIYKAFPCLRILYALEFHSFYNR